MTEEVFRIRKQMYDHAANSLSEPAASNLLSELTQEKLATEINDGKWEQWYQHFHQLVLQGKVKEDPAFRFQAGLNFCMQTSAVYVLACAIVLPSVRHWWWIAPAVGWSIILFAQSYTEIQNCNNSWSTLFQQIEYLRTNARVQSKNTHA